MSSLQMINIKKSYNNTEVLHGINADIKKGEFIVIVGPSGCGKSSLLRMVAGLESITEGELLLENNKINDTEPMHRDIAMVFQNYALYPHMSVYQNIAYGLKMRKFKKAEIDKRVNDVSKMLEISHLLLRKPGQLSGGQRQRVAMGRAIVRKPALFLFDEPLSNLDAKLRMGMRLEIKKMQRRLNITSLYVTHDQVEAMTMADRVMVLNNGTIEQFDTPQVVFNQPRTKFVANFMSNSPMNFFDGKFLTESLALNDARVLDCQVGIRAEDMIICEASMKSMPLKVELIEILGEKKFVHGFLDNSQAITLKCLTTCKVNEGETLSISIKMDKMHLFNKRSEINILN